MGEVVSLIGLALSLTTFLSGVILAIRSATIKGYAAERDFNHLKRNYEQLNESLRLIHEDIEKLELQMIEMKVFIQTLNRSRRDE